MAMCIIIRATNKGNAVDLIHKSQIMSAIGAYDAVMVIATSMARAHGMIRSFGKENGVNILKSIDEGPFQMGTFRETLAEGNEDALHLGLERARVYFDHSPKDKDRMQLNSKFVNNMLPEWGRFVTTVKLNRGLKESNYDQLYAYLKQHEAHANENKMMLERFTQHTVDPLALMSNVSPQQYSSQSSTTPSSTHVPPVTYQPHFADNTQLDSGLSPTDNLIENLTNTLALLTQSYKTYLPQTNNQLRTSSNTRNQATVQDGRVVVQNVQGRQNRGQGNNPRGAGAAGNGGAQNRVGNANPGQARQIKCYNCNDDAVDEDVDEQPVHDLTLNVDNVFQADDCDAFDSDVDEAPTAQIMFMANLSSAGPIYDEASPSYDSDILSEVVHIVLWYLDLGCSKLMTGDRLWLKNFVKKFIGKVRFGNDHFGAIMGYGDYVTGDSVISMVYYVEVLGHNLFSVRQFCDSDLEVAFRKHSCYVRDTDGVDLIKGSRGSNLYTISVEDMMKSSPICLLSKASKNKSWLWHRRLNHLNFGTINDLARKDLVRGLPRLKFEKDHLCSACQLGKSKKHTHTPKTKNTNLEFLNTLHMDLCGPMRVQTINGKKYILVIVDDYSRFTWVKFLRSKDETPKFVIKFLKQIQVGLNKTVRYIRTDNGTEFVNQVLTEYYESVSIFHQKSVPRTPQQNGVIERQNRTLVEAARTMLIFSKALMFLWAEVVATACYT
ncbi:retrovirus-related pol polyprotein from transposon TNT 1-94 [Tanacetum coccineum]